MLTCLFLGVISLVAACHSIENTEKGPKFLEGA